MPCVAGRSSTLTRLRYWACLSTFTVVSPSRLCPTFRLGAAAGRHGKGVGGFARHAELTAGKLGRDVFARLAGDGELQVVNGRRAVHRHGREQPAADPVDQVRPAAGLDDMAT